MTETDIPHYFLYGESAPSDSLAYVHIAALEKSLPKHNWEIHPHRHDNMHQLLFIEKGSVLVQMNEAYSEEWGTCVISVPSRQVHGFVHQPDVRGFIVTITNDFLFDLFRDVEREACAELFRMPLIVRQDSDNSLRRTMRQLWLEYRRADAVQASMLGAYLKILFILIHRSRQPGAKPVHTTDSRIKAYEQFLNLLGANYAGHWSIARYAAELGMSAGRLNRICQSHSGRGALQIVHERLITEARLQLIYTHHSAKEISYALGFKDPGYFSRFFNRHCQLTPGQFRRQVMQQRYSFPGRGKVV